MSIQLKRRAVRHFNSPVLTPAQNKSMRRKWLRCVIGLGTKWVLHPQHAAPEQQKDLT